MSDDRVLDALDQRGRAAAVGVRAAVADRPVPELDPDLGRVVVDPDRRWSPRSRRVLLAAAAAVVVVVATVVALAGTGEDDSAPTERITPGLQPYALGSVPDGYELIEVVESTDVYRDPFYGDQGPVAVYGPDVQTPRLGVFVWAEDLSEVVSELGGALGTAEVRGRRAWDLPPAQAGRGAVLVEVDGVYVGVVGASAGSAIADAAAAVTVDGDAARLPLAARPEGWSLLGEITSLSFINGDDLLGSKEWSVRYGRWASEDAEAPTVTVRVVSGSEVQMWAPTLVRTDTEPMEVRGHEAVLVPFEDTPSWRRLALRWQERRGLTIELEVSGDRQAVDALLAAHPLLALAEGVEAVGPGDVIDLRRQALEMGAEAPDAGIVGRGQFSAGADWALFHFALGSEQVTLRTTIAGAAPLPQYETGAPTDDGLYGAVGTGGVAGVTWAFGLIGDDVAAVEVRARDDGEEAPVTIVAGDGLRGWVAELPPGDGDQVPAHTVSALGAGGEVLRTVEIGA